MSAGQDRDSKQSSGDLHSRLKTRKLLGVGETDDGNVHRSKISQILGHSEQLRQRCLSWQARTWLAACGLACATAGIAVLCEPKLFIEAGPAIGSLEAALAGRQYGSALIAMSMFLWLFWRSQDRDSARLSIGCVAVFAAVNCALLWTHPARWLAKFGGLAMAGLAAVACVKFCQLTGG